MTTESSLDLRWRRRVALLAAVVVVGLAHAWLLAPGGKPRAMPGPLVSSHAPLETDCAHCHVASLTSIQSPLHGLVNSASRHAQSSRCLTCHEDLAESPLSPHGRADTTLAASVHGGTHAPAFGSGDIACATCHREHHGRDASLTALGDTECQACHQQSFEAFDAGHPALGAYPYDRGALHFDHRAHIQEHFADITSRDVAPDTCSDCHSPDASGERMVLRPFEVTCGACHADDIAAGTSQGAGWAVFSLPALDVEAIESDAFWPSDAALVETPLAPALARMLASDPLFTGAWDALADVDLFDMLDADDTVHTAASVVIERMRTFFEEVAHGGHDALAARLDGDAAATRLIGQVPGGLMLGALDAWWPEGAEFGDEVGDMDGDPTREDWPSHGGWYRQDSDFTLRYRPTGHADAVLTAWIEEALAQRDAHPALIRELADTQSVGQCARCHELEAPTSSSEPWTTPRARDLTHFSHATHFPALGDAGCARCHTLAEPSDASSTSGFRALEITTCTSCHESGGVSSTCLTCHEYHQPMSSTAMPHTHFNLSAERLATGMGWEAHSTSTEEDR